MSEWQNAERGRGKGFVGWWNSTTGHKYERRSVEEDVEEFIGWKKLLQIIDECENSPYYSNPGCLRFTTKENINDMRESLIRRDKALVAALFATGGRASEVLMLRTVNFILEPERFIVKNMPALKKIERKKSDEPISLETVNLQEMTKGKVNILWSKKLNSWIKRTYSSTPKFEMRLRFPIPLFEPTTKILLNYLEDQQDFLFPTSYKITSKRDSVGIRKHIENMGLENRAWISPTRVYKIVEALGERTGLNIWVHWARSQRASQLAEEYGFDKELLCRFFSWSGEKFSEPDRYAKLSVEAMWERMKPEKMRL